MPSSGFQWHCTQCRVYRHRQMFISKKKTKKTQNSPFQRVTTIECCLCEKWNHSDRPVFAQAGGGRTVSLQREIRGFFFSGNKSALYPVCGVDYANLNVWTFIELPVHTAEKEQGEFCSLTITHRQPVAASVLADPQPSLPPCTWDLGSPLPLTRASLGFQKNYKSENV